MTDWLEFANERSDWRTETGKNYELDPASGLGQFGLEARTGPVHYQENGISGPWNEIDTEYVEDKGTYLWYPRMHNKISVFKNRLGYEIVSPSGHLCRIELISVDGTPLSDIPGAMRFVASIDKHPFKVGIKAKSSYTLNKNYTVRWKITEIGSGEGDRYPFAFKPQREAFSVDDLTGLIGPALDAVRLNVQSSRTDIDSTSWYLDEIWPKGARLINPNTDFQVGAGNCDITVFWFISSMWYSDVAYGYAATGYNSVNSNHGGSGNRFANVNIPGYSTINSAYLKPTAWTDQGINTVNSYLIGEKTTNAAVFSDTANYQSRRGTVVGGANNNNITTAKVAWDSIPAWTNDTQYTSPDIKTIIGEITSLVGWVSGNALVVFFDDHDGRSTAVDNTQRFYYLYEGSTTKCVVLSVTWTPPTIKVGRLVSSGPLKDLSRGILIG